MKRIFLFLALMGLIGAVAAYDDTLDSIGVGYWPYPTNYGGSFGCGYTGLTDSFSCFSGSNSPSANAVSSFYFQVKYPGAIHLYMDYDNGGTTPTLYYLNYSAGVYTWSACSGLVASAAVHHGIINQGNCSSNTGVYALSASANLIFYGPDFQVSYLGSPDYSGRNYSAGSSYDAPVLNKYAFGTVGFISQVGHGDLTGYNASGFYYRRYKPYCELGGGVTAVNVINSNTTNLYQYATYSFYANMNPKAAFSFLSASPSGNGSTFSVSQSTVVPFNVVIQNPEAVEAVVWYVTPPDSSSPVQPVLNTPGPLGTSYNFTASDFDAHLYGSWKVEVQLEDDTCGRFSTYAWTVDTSGTVTKLYGSVKDVATSEPIVGASVSISGPSFRFATTDINGSYDIQNVLPGSYTVTAQAANYASQSKAATVAGGSPSYVPFYLNTSGGVVNPSASATLTLLLCAGLNCNSTNFTAGDYVPLYAYYNDAQGNKITDAACSYTSPGFSPTSGTMPDAGDGYDKALVVGNTPGAYSVSVSCFKIGYPSLTASASFSITSGSAPYTYISWTSDPSSGVPGDTAYFEVRYRDSGGLSVDDATCSFTWNGSGSSMSGLGGSYYSASVVLGALGSYIYSVNCSKAGYSSAVSSSKTFQIASVTPTTLPASCANGVKDKGETDVDCGGPCPKCATNKKCLVDGDCITNYCNAAKKCAVASCSDGVKNGLETGIDCGGGCPACACFVNWDCANDGSEHCDQKTNLCVRDTCVPLSGCENLFWDGNIYTGFSCRLCSILRYCVNGLCSFGCSGINCSSKTELSISIQPITSYSFNGSAQTVFVSNCEDGTNGFIVSSSRPTDKYYFHILTPYAPSVAANTQLNRFGVGNESVTMALLPELCEIPVGSPFVFSGTTFEVLDQGSVNYQTAYMLTFRERFKVNVSTGMLGGVHALLLNGTRNMTCRYRVNSADEWAWINSVPAYKVVLLNSSSATYQFYCNSSYGEEVGAKFNSGNPSFIFLGMVLGFAGQVTGFVWEGLFGGPFVWEAWMIGVFAVVFVLGIPTVVIVGYFMWRGRGPKEDKV